MKFVKITNKKEQVYSMIMAIAVSVFITFLATTVLVYNKMKNCLVANTNDIPSIVISDETDFSKLKERIKNVRALLSEYYLGDIKENSELIDGAVKGYVEALGDEYTEYFTAEEMTSFMEDTTGKYVGIGIYMQAVPEDKTILVLSTMKGSPAESVGLLSGDKILKVNGEIVDSTELSAVSDKIKGEEGTIVKLEILRGQEILEFEIERKPIEVEQVASKMLEKNVGYIEISTFSEDAAIHFEEQYKELEKQGIKSLIIDLRNNGGGIVSEALNIASLFVKNGDTLLIQADKNNKEEITKSQKEPIVKIPVVVLVNEYTASASEILAGILRDNLGVRLIGQKTFGKGVIQSVVTLIDGSGIKITTNEYFTPNHTKINDVGLTPDEEVELTESTETTGLVSQEDDMQLQKALELVTK